MSKLKFTLASAATTITAVALVLAGAGPASAYVDPRSLPSGDAMYAIDCSQTETSYVQLYSVNAQTAEPTAIGDGTPHFPNGSCSAQPAWNAANSTAYFIEQTFIDGPVSFLMTMDLATGESTQVDPFFVGDDTNVDVDSMAITPSGAAYAFANGSFFSVDLSNAHLTFLGETIDQVFGFGSDPVTGALWAVDQDANVFTINPANGAASFVAVYDVDEPGPAAGSLQIDSAGIVWVSTSTFDGIANELWSNTQVIGPDSAFQGAFDDFIEPFFSRALLVVPAKALAATGSSFDGSLVIGAGAVLLLIGGALVILRRRAATA